jgi:hypothetical protein
VTALRSGAVVAAAFVASTGAHAGVIAARPSVELAVILPLVSHKALPWPLTEPPSLQPHWAPARADNACELHANDHDAVAYVGAWCRIRTSDRGAIVELGKLANSARFELARAARLDIVNLVADSSDAKDAMSTLHALSLDDTAALDLLAATYVALGSREQADIVEHEVVHGERPVASSIACERLKAFGRLDDADLVQRLSPFSADRGECGVIARAVRCATDRGGCQRVVGDAPIPDTILALRMYFDWRNDYGAFEQIGRFRSHSIGLAWFDEVAVTALENAMTLSNCNPDSLATLRTAARRIAEDPTHDRSVDDRLDAVGSRTRRACLAER